MIRLSTGNALSLYCSGQGWPTMVLETGLGGGAYGAWYKLQPMLARRHRTCSYDRAGYGFSELGNDLPRDLKHDVRDLHEMLQRSGEKPPYILVGHSNGGLIVGAFADLYPNEVKGLVFLDAAIAIKKYPVEPAIGPDAPHPNKYLEEQLRQIAACRSFALHGDSRQFAADRNCVFNAPDGLSPRMALAERSNEEKASFWTALLSETENNYRDVIAGQAMGLLPHHWARLPIRVFTAAIPDVDDEKAAELFGIPAADKAALAQARSNRRRWEELQAHVCRFSTDCKVVRIRTTMHLVQNANPELVAETIDRMMGPGEE